MFQSERRDDTAPSRGEEIRARTENLEAAYGDFADVFEDHDLIDIMRDCERENLENLSQLRSAWARSYRAFHSKHWVGSKYTTEPYKARSKVFKPKTRTAVRSKMAAAAAALFSTNDVVAVKAEHDDDLMTSASAAVLHELLNYRLDRSSVKGGTPWFQMAMGSCFDALMTGVCASYQSWDYRTAYKRRRKARKLPPRLNIQTGQTEQLDETDANGEPVMGIEEIEEVTVDRPHIELLPVERVWLDLRAPWYDPVQLGAYATVRFPYTVGDAMSFLTQQSEKQRMKWLPIEKADLVRAYESYDSTGLRQERKGNDKTDPQNNRRAPSDDFKTVWLHLNFMRFDGCDYCWWSLGTDRMLSQVAYTEDIYPEQFGLRPVTYGVGNLEPHILFPQSTVESLQPLQTEINDLTNLNLDATRQSIEPIAKIKAGSVFDVKQLRNRGAAGANIIVRNMDDLAFDRWPPPPGNVYQQMNFLNLDFDSLAGQFDGSSVQANRQMNETVGGMRLLAGSANSVAEFDLRIWSETWVEPTIRMVMKLIQFYESDEKALAVAGKRAKLLQRYGVDEITNEMLEAEVAVTVNVGIGAADPMQRMAKLQQATGMIAQAGPFGDKPVKVNMEEFIGEIMGAAGYKDGMRFFIIPEQPPEEQPDPEVVKAEAEAALEEKKLAQEAELAQAQMALDREIAQGETATEQRRLQAELRIAGIQAQIAQTHLAIERQKLGTAQFQAQAGQQQTRQKMQVDSQMARQKMLTDQRHAEIATAGKQMDIFARAKQREQQAANAQP